MLLVDDLAAGGTKNLRHTPRGLVTLLIQLIVIGFVDYVLMFFMPLTCELRSCTTRVIKYIRLLKT